MGKRLKAKAGKGSGKLANALARHQAAEKVHKDTVAKQAKVAEQKKSVPKKVRENQEAQKQNQKEFLPFTKDDYVMLVGEGDFSFALSIVEQGYVKPTRLIVTSFDNSPSELKLKYPHTFESNYNDLLNIHKVKMFFKVDATSILKSLKLTPKTVWKTLGVPKIDVIMFNFPHTGRGMKDQDRNIRDHQMLVLGYFKSSIELFKLYNSTAMKNDVSLNVVTQHTATEPKIVLSVFEGEPYDSWAIKSLSKTLGLHVERSGAFQWELFPHYHHRRTNSEQDTTKKANERKARIYVFEKFKRASKKKAADSDSDDE
ncbi:Ferredoxin-fold anticodon-binding domain-containing protein 1 [Cyberlindnera fabianii]|uniref:Ferredoxin-fold anticodon-binding domain-containing protein 1 n=1 Tax=Cyberlindnera fabianii TaxID=36022 RepID=A0A1V2L5L0_CYBFA|nr:Ferredoxin-fold anticodon-binding domain-containing protein 1 [Cyberlindnera fabianii]